MDMSKAGDKLKIPSLTNIGSTNHSNSAEARPIKETRLKLQTGQAV